MNCAGKQKERQHAVHHHLREIDLQQRLLYLVVEVLTGKNEIEQDEQQRGRQAHDQKPDRVRQADEPMVQPAEQGREREQQRGEVEKRDQGGFRWNGLEALIQLNATGSLR